MSWRDRLLLTAYPELRRYPLRERESALARARSGAFDMFECLGLLLAAVLVTALTRYSSAGLRPIEILGVAGTSFFVALALLLVLGGPFLLRRTRRHLAAGLRDRAM
jgi:hypothetical protein